MWHLEANLGYLGANLGHFVENLRQLKDSLGHLEITLGHLETNLQYLEANMEHLEANLGYLEANKEHLAIGNRSGKERSQNGTPPLNKTSIGKKHHLNITETSKICCTSLLMPSVEVTKFSKQSVDKHLQKQTIFIWSSFESSAIVHIIVT